VPPDLHRFRSAFLNARLAALFAGGLLCLLVVAALGTGCQGAKQDKAPNARNGAETKGEGAQRADAVPVETRRIVRGPIAAYLAFNSTLETEAAVDLYPQIAGQVEEIFVEEGDRVEADAPLLRIDDRELRVEAREAEVNLRHLEATFARNEEVFRRGMINQQEFETQRFQLEQARLRHERAQLRLDQATVRAPFAGVVTARGAQVGARVAAGSKLFSLMKLDEIVAVVHVPGRHLAIVTEGQAAAIASDFLPDRRFEGWVKRISPVVDPRSGTFKVTVGVQPGGDDDGALRPGLFVQVRIVTARREQAVLVPKTAVVYEGGNRFIFTVDDGRATKRPLDGGFEDLEHVEARSGVDEGAQVVVLGQNGLKDGATVRIVNAFTDPTATTAAEVADASNARGED
jgi:membrane fusion protein (multidrug efflux system)